MRVKVSVVVTQDMVLVVGSVFADCSADEAGWTIGIVMLLDSTHVSIFLENLFIVALFHFL